MGFTLFTLVLAAHPTTLDKLRQIPTHSWLNVAIFLVSIYVIVRLWRTMRALNDYAPYIVSGIIASGVFFYWVYTRTEPAFLSPVVEHLTPFFPSRAAQQESVEKVRRNRE